MVTPLRANSMQEIGDLQAVLRARRVGWTDQPSLDRYRGSMEARWAALLSGGQLAPDELTFLNTHLGAFWPVLSGATLCCACSVAEADAGRCHRVWVAAFLQRAGWAVVLDGRPVQEKVAAPD